MAVDARSCFDSQPLLLNSMLCLSLISSFRRDCGACCLPLRRHCYVAIMHSHTNHFLFVRK